MADDRSDYAKHLLPCLAKPERVIVQAIVDYPELFDAEIASLAGASQSTVLRIRKRLGIPPAIRFPLEDIRADQLVEDNARLDAGICEVNLRDDYLKRYLEIRSCKERQIQFKPTIYKGIQ